MPLLLFDKLALTLVQRHIYQSFTQYRKHSRALIVNQEGALTLTPFRDANFYFMFLSHIWCINKDPHQYPPLMVNQSCSLTIPHTDALRLGDIISFVKLESENY